MGVDVFYYAFESFGASDHHEQYRAPPQVLWCSVERRAGKDGGSERMI